jgi:outer membrane protein assembly factor BamD
MLIVGVASGCGILKEKQDQTKSWSAQRLYDSAKSSLDAGDYVTAIEYYEKLESRFPFGIFAQQAQLELAYAYYKYVEPASSLAAADRFIKLYPSHPSIDYAHYLKGLVNFNRGKGLISGIIERYIPSDDSQRDTSSLREAFDDFAEVVENYPNSQYAKDSEQRLNYLRNTLAQHEINVANYYVKREAYIAAANRAKYVVENFQRAPVVAEALVIMAKCYKILALDDLSVEALRVLKLNFPTHSGISEVEDLVLIE